MLKRSMFITALIISGLICAGEASAQKKGGKRTGGGARVNSVQAPRDVASGQASGAVNDKSPGKGNPNAAANNVGDTGTHEVGQVKNRRSAKQANQSNGTRKKPNTAFRPSPSGDGTTEHFVKETATEANGVAKVGLGVAGAKQTQPRNKGRKTRKQ